MGEEWNEEHETRSAARRGGSERRQQWWRHKARQCYFCLEGIEQIDYKNPEMLIRFLSDRGKIKPRRQTGTCALHQRRLARAIKRARHLALLPFTAGQIRGG